MKAIKNWQRYVLEWGILAALIVFILVSHVIGGRINPDTYCPFGGIQAFANLISHGSLPCDMSSLQILPGIALLVAVVLFSKLFCAYLCPLGTISDLCRKLRDHFSLIIFGVNIFALLEPSQTHSFIVFTTDYYSIFYR